jgi:predicted  nucleic acid-binding Zn-ribbon protein
MCWHCHVYGHAPWAYYSEPIPPFYRRRMSRRRMLEEFEPEEEYEELEQEKLYLERRLRALEKDMAELKAKKE